MITTVVGNYPKIPNLPRPAALRKAIADFDAGRITREELGRIEDEGTVEVIREQIDAGVDLVTDGQIRWEDPQTYLARRLTGFTIDGLIRYFDSNTYYRQPVCEGVVTWTGPITVRDYEFAVQHSSRPVKAVLTGPYTLARLSDNRFYPTLDEFVLALAEALNREARALEAAGATFIQIDEPAIVRRKADWPLFERAMRCLTDGLTAKLALYTYFGDVQGLYPQILELPFAVLGLDFCQGAKNWQVLAGAPFTKELGFGIVNARNTKLESAAELHAALDRLSHLVPLERVHVNPSCGLEFLPRERAQEKLANMVEAVHRYKPAGRKAVGRKAKAPARKAAPRKHKTIPRAKTTRTRRTAARKRAARK